MRPAVHVWRRQEGVEINNTAQGKFGLAQQQHVKNHVACIHALFHSLLCLLRQVGVGQKRLTVWALFLPARGAGWCTGGLVLSLGPWGLILQCERTAAQA